MQKRKLQKMVSQRLATIKGHLAGIEKMVNEDKGCEEILFQLGAVNGSINKLTIHILEAYMNDCLSRAENIDPETSSRIEELIRTVVSIVKK